MSDLDALGREVEAEEPKADGRCTCGSRWFTKEPVLITCRGGTAWELQGICFVVCIECGVRWLYPAEYPQTWGPKKLLRGREAMRVVRAVAEQECRNDNPEYPPFHIVNPEDRDAVDLERIVEAGWKDPYVELEKKKAAQQ